MLVYIAVNEIRPGERNILGAFTEEQVAWQKLGEYAAENPEEDCAIETVDTEVWLHDTGGKYRPVHRTMVHKRNGMKSHVIEFLDREEPIVAETEDWYIVCRQDNSFDREEGMQKNLEILEPYLEEKN